MGSSLFEFSPFSIAGKGELREPEEPWGEWEIKALPSHVSSLLRDHPPPPRYLYRLSPGGSQTKECG